MESPIRIYRYRWVVLAVFALLNVLIQIHWVALAPITHEAAQFYGVSDLSIGFLSMLFMLVYIVVSVTASYVIDHFGLRIGVGTGAVLLGVFGLLKGLEPSSYTGENRQVVRPRSGARCVGRQEARWCSGRRGCAPGAGTIRHVACASHSDRIARHR